MKTSRQ